MENIHTHGTAPNKGWTTDDPNVCIWMEPKYDGLFSIQHDT